MTVSYETAPSRPLSVIIVVLPFIIFYWMAPFISDLTLGHDYVEFAIRQQMELFFSIEKGSFPLYVPGFALGHSSSALTQGQVFHPISYIASALPGYWDGKALQWNTFLRLLSLGLTQLVLFLFLRKIRLNNIFAFLLSFITVYNLRMLDLFRYGASLEAYTSHLLLCAAIGWYFIKPAKWFGPISIILLTYLLICSGHPREMYYALLGSVLFAMVVPYFVSTMLDVRGVHFKDALTFWTKVGVCLVLGILLSSAYILPFYFDFIDANTLRVGQSYAANSQAPDTFWGSVNNFFFPYMTEIHSAFGGSSLILISAVLPALRLFRIKIPSSIWTIWGLLVFSFLLMQGDRTIVDRIVWELLPFASSMRGTGRNTLFMPIIMMLLLAWIVKLPSRSFSLRNFSVTIKPYVILIFISLILIGAYSLVYLFVKIPLGVFTPQSIHNLSPGLIGAVLLIGILSLLLLLLYDSSQRASTLIGILLGLAVCVQTGLVLRYGTFIAPRKDRPTLEFMEAQKRQKLDHRYNPGAGMYHSAVIQQLEHSFLEPFLAKIYYHVIPVKSQEKAYSLMERSHSPEKVFIEGYDEQRAERINNEGQDVHSGEIKLEYSSFNRLRFSATAPAPAILGFSYPYSGHWNALVNGERVPVYRANGAIHAVEIPAGKSQIDFRYWSASAFWGMIISCVTFMLVGTYISVRALSGLPRAAAVISVIVAAAGVFILWNHSLYNGDNLGMDYAWNYQLNRPNLAYGKKTTAIPASSDRLYQASSYFRTHRSRIVDGNVRTGSGHTLLLHNNPALIIDLYRSEDIGSVDLYADFNKPQMNIDGLSVSLSRDGEQWESFTYDEAEQKDHLLHFQFQERKNARYIKIQIFGEGRFVLDEVEVHGP
jgi:hypothetical protein